MSRLTKQKKAKVKTDLKYEEFRFESSSILKSEMIAVWFELAGANKRGGNVQR